MMMGFFHCHTYHWYVVWWMHESAVWTNGRDLWEGLGWLLRCCHSRVWSWGLLWLVCWECWRCCWGLWNGLKERSRWDGERMRSHKKGIWGESLTTPPPHAVVIWFQTQTHFLVWGTFRRDFVGGSTMKPPGWMKSSASQWCDCQATITITSTAEGHWNSYDYTSNTSVYSRVSAVWNTYTYIAIEVRNQTLLDMMNSWKWYHKVCDE